MKKISSIILLIAIFSCVLHSRHSNATEAALPKLKVSENKRFLVTENDTPFFWLGDTAWELFHRLDREEAINYLDNRQKLGFTVIQAVALAELDGHSKPNAYGHLPLADEKTASLATIDGPENDYWDHVDFIVDEANKRGMYVGFLPTWGRYWTKEQIFKPENAEKYGETIGKRYKDKGVIWIIGGDRNIEHDEERATLIAMANGIKRGDNGTHLITFHPTGGGSSSQYFHDEPWLDFNMRQNGHGPEYGSYAKIKQDYDRTPIKPILDGEPLYEDHPIHFSPDNLGHSIAADVRRPLYWNLFNGAFGHTYGHHSVWQMYDPADANKWEVNRPLMPWYKAIEQPGAEQMQYGRKLIESRPFLTRIPDMNILVPDRVTSAVPGSGIYRFAATRDTEGTYAFIYVPVGREFSVRMDTITGEKVRAWWYNPRNGEASLIGEFSNTGEKKFISPTPGEHIDWILVLDDAEKNYHKPGTPINNVRLQKRTLSDNNGPFLGLGVTYMSALHQCKYNHNKLLRDLALLKNSGFNYIRVLSMVSWEGKEIAPVDFTNRDKIQIAAWKDYDQQIGKLIDTTYDNFGLRVELTIFADAQRIMPSEKQRYEHIDRVLEIIKGREHKIIMLEVGNEAWQNGFSGNEGNVQMREMCKYIKGRTSIPTALSAPYSTEATVVQELYADSNADIATIHFSRDTRTEDGWIPVRDCWESVNVVTMPVSSNEPIGPGSSVASEKDATKLLSAAVFAWIAGVPMYVFHSSAGVYGNDKFEDTAGIDAFTNITAIMPPDVTNWTRFDVASFDELPIKMNVRRTVTGSEIDIYDTKNGCTYCPGAYNDSNFVLAPMGVQEKGITLHVQLPADITVYDPITGDVVFDVSSKQNDTLDLPKGSGIYIIKGKAKK
ncbi:MAG: glycoside hydrolase family 140 protein [Thermoguttaceae bacterium]